MLGAYAVRGILRARRWLFDVTRWARSPRGRWSALRALLVSSSGAVARERRGQIGLEVVDVLEPDMEPEHVARCRPISPRCGSFGMDRQAKALIAAPGPAHAEQLEAIDHRRQRGARLRAPG